MGMNAAIYFKFQFTGGKSNVTIYIMLRSSGVVGKSVTESVIWYHCCCCWSGISLYTSHRDIVQKLSSTNQIRDIDRKMFGGGRGPAHDPRNQVIRLVYGADIGSRSLEITLEYPGNSGVTPLASPTLKGVFYLALPQFNITYQHAVSEKLFL